MPSNTVFRNRHIDEGELNRSSYPDVSLMTFEEYAAAVRECLSKALKGFGSDYIESRYRLYETDLLEFYRKKWSPEGAAAAIVFGY